MRGRSFVPLTDAAPGDPEPVLAITSAPVDVKRIVVLKLDHRGDFIMAAGAFEHLRARFADAHITLVCGVWNEAEAAATGLFDRVVGSAFFPEFVHQENRVIGDGDSLAAFAALLVGERFDLAIDLRLHEETRPLLRLLDATLRAGLGTTAAFPFLDVALPFANPTQDARSRRMLLRAERFAANVGTHEGFAIVSPEPNAELPPGSILVFGPYQTLEPGNWEITLAVEPLAEAFVMAFDVTAEGGQALLGAGGFMVERGGHPRLTLHLAETANDVEVRLRVGPSGLVEPFRFLGAQASRRGVFAGPHQAEMQFLLCALVGFRLAQNWRVAAVPQ